MRVVGTVLLSLVLPTAGLAADIAYVSPPKPTGYTITLGVEGRYIPRWDGADDMRFVPVPIVNIRPAGSPYRFRSARDGIGFGLVDTGNFRFGPVGKIRTGRDVSDDPVRLAGLRDVDWTLELGVFAEYWVLPWLRTRAELRQGIGGHRGLVGDLTADAVWRATQQLTLSAGPRMTVNTAAAADPYFSITPAEAIASGLPAFNAKGGLRSYGVGAKARYEWTPQWSTHVFAEYERLGGSAGDSPLVQQRGDRDQWSFGAGLAYTFDMNWGW